MHTWIKEDLYEIGSPFHSLESIDYALETIQRLKNKSSFTLPEITSILKIASPYQIESEYIYPYLTNSLKESFSTILEKKNTSWAKVIGDKSDEERIDSALSNFLKDYLKNI